VRKTITGVGIAVAAAALLLSGCGNSDQPSTMDRGNTASSSGGAPQASHNEADIAFAQQMIPHHQQAVEMAKLAASHSSNTKVKDLAGRIQQAQDPEIQQLNGWLAQWAATTPPTGMDHGSTTTSIPGMEHGSEPGMMTDDEMRQLEQANGAAFDRLFLEMMTKHHRGAIEMAKTEVANGANPDAKALAQRIIDAQQAEITEMQGLLTAV
jgi:uncharacterized protein (DUF305 family)